MNASWLEEIINKQIEELQSEEKSEFWFSLSAISNVPYISFPGFTEKECLEIQEQTKNVLRSSRNENNYKEVAITYKKDANNHDKEYIKVFGDYTSVFIMQNEKVKALLDISNKNEELVVISIHNHPNNSNFSMNDLLVFSENPSIKLMEIVNKNGEVSFLLRPKNIDLSKLVLRNTLSIVPDFIERKNAWQKQNPNIPFTFSDLLNLQERNEIVTETIIDIQEMGCLYSKYVDKDNAKDVKFAINRNIIVSRNNYNFFIDDDIDSNDLQEDDEYWDDDYE